MINNLENPGNIENNANGCTAANEKLKKNVCLSVMLTAGVALAVYEFGKFSVTENMVLSPIFNMIITRGLGSIVFVACVIYLGYNIIYPFRKTFFKTLLAVSPCFLVAINNFPIIPALSGRLQLIQPMWYIWLVAAECLFVGIFEEFAFRGVVFMMLLENRRKNKLQVFIAIILTSAVFGLVHLINLFEGAGIGVVIMQTGYSFLVGGMCSVVLIKTKNLWICAFLHALFNFCGNIIPTLGEGTIWDIPTIVVTITVAVAVAAYVIALFIKTDISEVHELYCDGKK